MKTLISKAFITGALALLPLQANADDIQDLKKIIAIQQAQIQNLARDNAEIKKSVESNAQAAASAQNTANLAVSDASSAQNTAASRHLDCVHTVESQFNEGCPDGRVNILGYNAYIQTGGSPPQWTRYCCKVQ